MGTSNCDYRGYMPGRREGAQVYSTQVLASPGRVISASNSHRRKSFVPPNEAVVGKTFIGRRYNANPQGFFTDIRAFCLNDEPRAPSGAAAVILRCAAAAVCSSDAPS
ncbi:uncharacterized protein UV8b_00039 [Ustilaginoidea virens]|uniref:Uncharacterized protein n=1 Tax=Ustilaginoidea virens TaxID=1159556 RepID=A0A8E5MD90_USTVR|nr:uncharacterized protein UV8b_00039 [Ustilaginoidea virens]QUC15798.1 hypothetical protein UV8b_00039 [Ustilaginoidea virens]